MRKIIKFKSADGLFRYEDWTRPNQPEHTLARIAVRPLQLMKVTEDMLGEPLPMLRREYDIYDHYLDPATGNEVYEYRERL